MKKILLSTIFAIALLGCGASLGTIIATVLTVVQDAIIIVDEVEVFVNSIDIPESTRADINDAIFACRDALSFINSLAKAGKSIDDKDVQAAIENFRDAFNKLMAIIDRYGIVVDGKETVSGVPIKHSVRAPLLLRPVAELR